jgi:hypothetical protein
VVADNAVADNVPATTVAANSRAIARAITAVVRVEANIKAIVQEAAKAVNNRAAANNKAAVRAEATTPIVSAVSVRQFQINP